MEEERVGMCKHVEGLLPKQPTFRFQDTDPYAVVYINKKELNIGDAVDFYVFERTVCRYVQSFTVDHEVEGPYVYSQLTIPFLLSLSQSTGSTSMWTIGIARNDEQLFRVGFTITKKNMIYGNPLYRS